MLSFLAKKDKNKPSTYKPKVPPKYRTFFAKSYHANDRDNNMSKIEQRHIVISVICVICLAKKVQYFGGTFGL